MTDATFEEQIKDFLEHSGVDLEHSGVKGMKWGKRHGSLSSRVKGAALDRNQRDTALNTRVAEGRSSLRDKAKVLTRTSALNLIVNKGLKGSAAVKVSKLKDQKSRIESGKTKLKDKLETFGRTNLADLVLTRTDTR